ncbi:anaphase promoting complex subunit cdc16, partial [Cichlidogyrus casuarinus]
HYDTALEYHRKALDLVPDSPATLESIAFIYAFKGEYSEAITYLHRAMNLRPLQGSSAPDNAFGVTLLQFCCQKDGELANCSFFSS